jgi:protoporphyrinogen oxidase
MEAGTGADNSSRTEVVVIGAGPAGLTAAYTLLKKAGAAVRVTVIESDPQYVGGLSRTVKHNGFHFDIGGHRFFSKSKEIEDLWTEILPDDLLERPRSSRIYYRGKFFSYPLRAGEAFFKLGPFESLLCLASYMKARLLPAPAPRSFEDWVSRQFGRRLFRIFFKTYTEKVWGMSCREISADWAAQRIKGLSLAGAIKNAFAPGKSARGAATVKTLINSFRYPRKGPGQMWDACASKVEAMGGEIVMGRRVTRCAWDASAKTWQVTACDAEGHERQFSAHHVISSAPLRSLARALSPALSERALEAACALRYRDFLLVALMLKDRGAFTDNWIYVHDPGVRVGRIQNFKSWSPEMVPDASLNCYGMEYFCFKGDRLWSLPNDELVALARAELERIGLCRAADLLDARVVRQPKAYPVYDETYAANVAVLREELEARFPTLHVAGRNGMHKYNNQDHAMMTAILCAENVLAGERVRDVWRVNQDAEYHEAGDAAVRAEEEGLRLVPARVEPSGAEVKSKVKSSGR